MGVACDDFQVDSGLPLGFPYFQRHFPSTAVSQIAVKNPTRSRSEKNVSGNPIIFSRYVSELV